MGNRAGFSLIEVVIVSGIMMVLGLGLMQMFDSQQKMAVTAETQFDTADFLNQVRFLLSNEEACKQTFGGQPLAGGNVTKIFRAYKGAGGATTFADFATVGNPITRTIKLKSLNVKYVGAGGLFDGQGQLTVEIARTQKSVLGGDTITKVIPIVLTQDISDPLKISGCSYQAAAPQSPSTTCAALGGTFDPGNGLCKGLSAGVDGPMVYQHPVTKALQLDAEAVSDFTCSNCGSDCNACPSGWTQKSNNCHMGGNCGFHRWRDCTTTCGQPATVVGKIVK